MRTNLVAAILFGFSVASVHGQEAIRLANHPNLSPDGSQLAFDWNGDIWVVPSNGGSARALTQHPGKDTQPKFSPDGKEIAFVSDRDGSTQIYVMPATGGVPQRLTYHTAGYGLESWTPDGKQLLVRAQRDHYWRHADRFFLISREGRSGEELLFDDYGAQGSLSPHGRKLLFVREGAPWWRKGYHGSQASQVWMFDLDTKKFTKVCAPDRGSHSPLWKPDGGGCYIVSASNGGFNLHECNLGSGQDRQLTQFADDSVVQPCISKDGKVIVFRHLFDFYRYRPDSNDPPVKLNIVASGDRTNDPIERRVLTTATQVAFNNDGLEIAFIAGGDLWVMDTELKEPRRITTSVEEERDPVYSLDGQFLYFVSDMHGESNVWQAERGDKSKYWWQNTEFKLQRLTQNKAVKSSPKLSPDGKKIGYLRDRGDLWVMDSDGKNDKRIIKSFSPTEFNWSPDSAWLVYSAEDNDFNRDIWVVPLDGSKPAFNVSRTPFNERFPTWSPDGKVIAWTGKRSAEESDIHYVFLRAEDDQSTSRDKTLEKALEKMKSRRPVTTTNNPADYDDVSSDQGPATISPAPAAAVGPSTPNVHIDFDGIQDRIRSISIPESTETDLFWSPNGKRLAFAATVDGKRGTYAVEIPDDLKPKSLNSGTGSQARWLRNGQVVWLANGVPASFSAGGPTPPPTNQSSNVVGGMGGPARRGVGPPRTTPTQPSATQPTEAASPTGTEYRFQALHDFDRRQKNAAAFDLSWRIMRDNFYDERLGNRNWDAIRMKYIEMATNAVDTDSLATVVNLMLGELNGSHLGFTPIGPGGGPARRNAPTEPVADPALGTKWSESTGHLGLRFDETFAGPGLKVRDVLPASPAEHVRSLIKPGEIVVAIDGKSVNPKSDLTAALNGPPNRELSVRVKDAQGVERTVSIRPISFSQARQLLYKHWLAHNQKTVETLSDGKLGYVHIDAMAMPSFYRFQNELYAIGAGKEGLIIDVRENGGGSTADHLLTALCQPEHAITVPRGGGQGYPNDRKVYACWNKPITVLCNQNSFSNAEIFSHAIKTLKRGQLVGVPTAGGVISTGAAPVMDVGMIRLPFRGWFLPHDGRDMELNGAVPDFVMWPEPGQMPAGKDNQLEKAVTVLIGDVKAFVARPRPTLQKASEIEAKNDQRIALDKGEGGQQR